MRNILYFFIAISLSGCASFAENKIPAIENTYTNSKNKIINIEYRITSVYGDNLLQKTLKESNSFNEIENYINDADYSLYVTRQEDILTNQAIVTATSYISGLSSYIIPSWYTAEIRYDVQLIDNKNKTKKHFLYEEKYKRIMHLTMLFALPFSKTQPDEIDIRMMRKMVFDIGNYINDQ